MKKNILLTVLAIITVAACAHTRYGTKVVSAPQKSPISIDVAWIKNKGKKVDLMATITNNTTKDIEVDGGEFTCARGGSQGSLRHDFGSAARPNQLTLIGEQTRTGLIHCTVGIEGEGNVALKIDQVFEQHEEDNKRRVMGKDLAWEFAAVANPTK